MPLNRKYDELAQLVKEQTGAEGAIVIVIKGDDSGLAFDLPPEMIGWLPEILRDCAIQSAADLRATIERDILPAMRRMRS